MASTVWKGHLTFGLVSLPVKLFSAARSESVSFNQLHASDHSRVKQVLYCQAEDKPVTRNELVKGYEYEKDKYVVIDEEDLKKAQPASAKTMEVLEFVKAQEVDAVYFESSYYMAPDEAGEKPYALFFEALKKSGYLAIAKLTMHNREYTTFLRPHEGGLMLHTMYYADEIRNFGEIDKGQAAAVKEAELKLAIHLIDQLSSEAFKPDQYQDEYRARVLDMVNQKIEGKQVTSAPAEPRRGQVIDLMQALKESLEKQAPQKKAARARRAEAVVPKKARAGRK